MCLDVCALNKKINKIRNLENYENIKVLYLS